MLYHTITYHYYKKYVIYISMILDDIDTHASNLKKLQTCNSVDREYIASGDIYKHLDVIVDRSNVDMVYNNTIDSIKKFKLHMIPVLNLILILLLFRSWYVSFKRIQRLYLYLKLLDDTYKK